MSGDELRRMLGGLPGKGPGRKTFRLGDTVRIRSGPFAAFTGKVEGINQSKALLKVTVHIFGKATPLKLGFADVDPIAFA